MASPYGPVLIDLLAAFQAVETPCPSASVQHDLCFDATPAGATQLAEALSEVVGGYATAGLGVGDWRAANGVWAVSLSFGGGALGWVDLYLTEAGLGTVRGTFIYYMPR